MTNTSPDSNFTDCVLPPRVVPPQRKRAVSPREIDHGGGEVFFVAVLVQAHFGVGVIEVDEAGFGVALVVRYFGPEL